MNTYIYLSIKLYMHIKQKIYFFYFEYTTEPQQIFFPIQFLISRDKLKNSRHRPSLCFYYSLDLGLFQTLQQLFKCQFNNVSRQICNKISLKKLKLSITNSMYKISYSKRSLWIRVYFSIGISFAL